MVSKKDKIRFCIIFLIVDSISIFSHYTIQLSAILANEDAYKAFAAAILSPIVTLDEQQRVKRSYRAMQVLTEDLALSPESTRLMNATRAGLLAKDIFAALHTGAVYLLHARKLLDSLLQSYPSSVVAAVCAGGTNGMEAHLRPLLLAETSSQTLPTLTHLVIYGCTGKMGQPSAEKTQQSAYNLRMTPSTISNGHRRKFIRNLADWGFLSRIVECIHDDFATVGEELCETVLTIVECLGIPERDAMNGTKQIDESVGEEILLASLGKVEWWDPLFAKLHNSNETTKVAAARLMMGIFTLATGTSSRIRMIDAPITDATETLDPLQPKDAGTATHHHKNKLLEWGLTAQIHSCLISHIPQICQAIMTQDTVTQLATTTYWNRGEVQEGCSGVLHPGRCCIVPFSTWRLHIVTLLAEIVSYHNDAPGLTSAETPHSLRRSAMSAIMDLPLPTKDPSDSEGQMADNRVNPWPSLCDWVFDYPENNLYHVQFIRLIRAITIELHEPTLRLVLQKVKFVSRGVRTCQEGGPLRGVLIECFNLLRLRSQSLPPSAFLKQFLQSHDGWKGFQDLLVEYVHVTILLSYCMMYL